MEQKEKRKITSIRIRPSVYQLARKAAEKANKTVAAWIDEAIQEKANGKERL